MTHSYKTIEKDLTSKEKFHIKLGLDRVKAILEILGNHQDDFKSIHIAGTNGKGSTASILAKVLEKSGYKTGLFTSPHLIKYNERIKISSKDISDNKLEVLLNKVNAIAKENEITLTEFEIITIIAFLFFKQEKVDIAIIEVGLGGRLDATNIINPIISIITTIGLDHTQRLGNTIEKISFEKSGIIKPNSKVVTSKKNAGIKIIKEVANQQNAQLSLCDEVENIEFKNSLNRIQINNKKYDLSLFGDFQGENLALALKALEILQKDGFKITDIQNSLKEVSWNARMQFLDTNVILDGAHNPNAATKLRETLDKYFKDKKRVWFFGALNNKDYSEIMKTLFREEDEIHLINFKHQSSLDFKNSDLNYKKIDISQFIEKYEVARKSDNLIIIAGSLYLAGDILALLGNT